MYNKIFAIFIIIGSFCHVSFADEVKTYGDLYLKDEIVEKPLKYKVGLEYSNETSNTFQSIHEGVLTFEHLPAEYFSLGIQGSLTSSEDRSFTDVVREKLAESGYRQQFEEPGSTLLASLGIRPLSGRLNFFQKSTVPFEVWVKALYGRAFYETSSVDYEVVGWQFNFNSFIYKDYGIQLGLGQEVENMFTSDPLAKFKVRVGCLLRF